MFLLRRSLASVAYVATIITLVVIAPQRALADGPTTLNEIAQTAQWKNCGGPAIDATTKFESLYNPLVCYAQENFASTTSALHSVITNLLPLEATNNPNAIIMHGQVYIALMRIEAAHHLYEVAILDGKFAREKAGDVVATDEQRTFWSMCSPDQRAILLQHGGTEFSNLDDRPQEWKTDGLQQIWVYRNGGGVTTYVFSFGGKLLQTFKP